MPENKTLQEKLNEVIVGVRNRQDICGKKYATIHAWLHYHYGKANYCEGEDCRKKSRVFNWALRPGKIYDKKRENFFQLCRSCHTRTDSTIQSYTGMIKANTGRKQSPDEREKRDKSRRRHPIEQLDLNGNLLRVWPSLREAARNVGVTQPHLTGLLYGRGKTLGGYKWKYHYENM